MSKKENKYVSVLKIICTAIKLYVLNLPSLLKYMLFPVIGQLIGIFLILAPVYLYAKNLPMLVSKYPIFDNILGSFTILTIILIPGFLIFTKAFWEYLVAMAALNSVSNNLDEKNEVKDFSVHNEVIRRKSTQYILMLMIISLVMLIPSFIIFIPGINIIIKIIISLLLTGIILLCWVYLSLSFQSFALDDNIAAIDSIKKSITLVKYNFGSTIFLLVLVFVIAYYLLPDLCVWLLNKSSLTYKLSFPIEAYLQMMPIDIINRQELMIKANIIFEPVIIAQYILAMIVSFIVTGFTLPLRSLICTKWYKLLNKEFHTDTIESPKTKQKKQN